MSSNPTRDPYFRTCGGVDIRQETYWRIEVEGKESWYFRFIELFDSAGGMAALIQDEVGTKTMSLHFFDDEHVNEVTDPEEIALAMLAIHG